jgi:hypothetical protein
LIDGISIILPHSGQGADFPANSSRALRTLPHEQTTRIGITDSSPMTDRAEQLSRESHDGWKSHARHVCYNGTAVSGMSKMLTFEIADEGCGQ